MVATSETPFEVERFARVFVEDPARIPTGSDAFHDDDRGFYFKLHLDQVSTTEASDLISKAKETFDVEIVKRVSLGDIVKERVYIDHPDQAPPDARVEEGPQGGLYYETREQVAAPDAGDTRSVGVITWDDLETGDDIVFETPDGDEVFAEVIDIDERPGTPDRLTVEYDGETYEAHPGTYSVDKSAGRLIKDTDDPWVAYTGPRGGEGWYNRQTGEVRYQDQHPARAEEQADPDELDFDPTEPPEDGYARGWEQPLSPEMLYEGQVVEFFDEDGYGYGEVVEVGADSVVVESEGGERHEADTITAIESDDWDPTDVPDVEFREQVDPADFAEAVEQKIEENPEMGAFLTAHDAEHFGDFELIMNEEGTAGAAVSPDGDAQNLFSLEDAEPGAGRAVMKKAFEEHGAITLDCYDGYLRDLYAEFGFRETARMEFDPEYAPDGWNFEKYGEPDVVFMHYDPEEELELSDDYRGPAEWGDAKQDSRREADTSARSPPQGRGVREGERGADPGSGSPDGRPVTADDLEIEGDDEDELVEALNGPELERLNIDINPDPDLSRWGMEGEVGVAHNPEAYGYTGATVGIPIEDFRRLQEYIAIDIPGIDVSYEDWWNQAFDEDVDQMAAVLAGEAEAREPYDDGLPTPWVEFGRDGSLRFTQEGRHRTLAAEQAGLDEIPVRIIYNDEYEGDEGPLAKEGILGDVSGEVMASEGSVTSSTPGVHSARHSEEDDGEEPLESDLPEVIDLVKEEGRWTYYYGPEGGEGWINLDTGEIRYQQQRPGPGPEGGDGYDDWLADGWAEPPEDLGELQIGQPIEFKDHQGEFQEGEYGGVNEQGNHFVRPEDDPSKEIVVGPDFNNDITAVAEDWSRHDSWFEDKDFTEEEYFDIEEEIPEDAPDEFQGLEIGPDYHLELPTGDVVEMPFVGYVDPDDHPTVSSESLMVRYDDLEAEVGRSEMYDNWGEPGKSSPLISVPASIIEDDVVGGPGVGEYEPESDEPEKPEASEEPLFDAYWPMEDVRIPVRPEETAEGDMGYRVVEGIYEGAWINEGKLEDIIPENEAAEEFEAEQVEEEEELPTIDEGPLEGQVAPADDPEVETDLFVDAGPDTSIEDLPEGMQVVVDDGDGNYTTAEVYPNDIGYDPGDGTTIYPDEVGIAAVHESGWKYIEGDAEPAEAEEAEEDATGPEEDEASEAVAEATGAEADDELYVFAEDYDPDDVEEWGSLVEFGFPEGVSSMEVGRLPHYDGEDDPTRNEGLVFRTKYGPGETSESLGYRQLVAHDVGDALGARMPTHVGDPADGWVDAEGIDGQMAADHTGDGVDREDFMEQAAFQIILGNFDAHSHNVHIDPEGRVWMIDIDHSTGDITDEFTGEKTWYDSSVDRATGELLDSASSLGIDTTKEELLGRAIDVAAQFVDDGEIADYVADAIEESSQWDAELAENVRSNIINLAAGDVQL